MVAKILRGCLCAAIPAVMLGGCWRATKDWKMAYRVDKIKLDEKIYPSVIVGGGVGGLTSAIYLAQARCTPLVLEGNTPGGALAKSHSVRNWPGVKDAPGAVIVDTLREHALGSGAELVAKDLVSADFSLWPFAIKIKDLLSGTESTIRTLSCIISTGAIPNYLGIPGERGQDGYWGRGVTNCAICDGSLYKDKTVAIVGGGDSAIVETDYLASIARTVHVLVRKDAFKASGEVKDRVLARPNVNVHFNTVVKRIEGDGTRVTNVILTDVITGSESSLPIDGLFLAIGSRPNSWMFKDQIDLDPEGYITLVRDQQTSQPGVFAIGDVSDRVYRQAITAAGEGSRAALQTLDFLRAIGFQPGPAMAGSSAPSTSARNTIPGPEAIKETSGERSNVSQSSENQAPVIESAPVVAPAADEPVKQVTDANAFRAELKSLTMPAVVDFFATWCMPCKMMHPIYEEVAKQFAGRVAFYRVNVDEVKDLSGEYSIQGIPTFIFISKSGSEMSRAVGATDRDDLAEQVEALLR